MCGRTTEPVMSPLQSASLVAVIRQSASPVGPSSLSGCSIAPSVHHFNRLPGTLIIGFVGGGNVILEGCLPAPGDLGPQRIGALPLDHDANWSGTSQDFLLVIYHSLSGSIPPPPLCPCLLSHMLSRPAGLVLDRWLLQATK